MMMRTVLLVMGLTAAAGGVWAAPNYDPSPFGINGIKYEFIYKNPNAWENARKPAKVMRDAGIYWDRDGISWAVVEPERGKWDWTCPDAVAKFNREEHLNSIILLSGCAAWANGVPPKDDAERAEFADYVYRMVSRYKDTFKVWEIWNEPNIPFFWQNPNAGNYTLLLKEAYKAAKRADPECTVLAGNTSGPDLTFIRGIHEHGGWDYFDGLCTHPYSLAGGPISQRYDRICRMINEFVKSTGKPKPVWITEVGWTAQKQEEETSQAIFLIQTYVVSLANGVEKICSFDLDDWEEKWGIIRTSDPFKPKLAYGAYKLMTEHLGSPGKCASFEGYLKMPSGVACYVFKKPGRARVLILWSDELSAQTVKLAQQSGLSATDILGKTLAVEKGRVAVGAVPIIVTGADSRKIGVVSSKFSPYLEKKGQNLLSNGSLDYVVGSNPAWWNAGRFDGTAKDCTFATNDEGRNGSKCVSISKSGERAAWDAVCTPIYPGRKYRLTAWVKTRDATGNNQIGLFWHTGNMWTYISESRSESTTGTCDWTKVTLTATAPRDAMFLRANLISEKNSGATWFDDVELVEE